MRNREDYIKRITRYLTTLRVEVELRNCIKWYDINIIAEDFYTDLLNLYEDYNLENLNITSQNAESIDLIDKENKIAIQVTSRNDTSKIHDTIKGFYNNPDYDQYNRLIMLLIGKPKLDYPRTDFTHGNLFVFDKKEDIIDIADILKRFASFNSEQLEPIVDFLEKEIETKIKKVNSNEVETIIRLIEFLSDDNNLVIDSEKNENVDPEKKIRKRFVEYSQNLEKWYKDLLSDYSESLNIAKNTAGIDGVKARIISAYLQDISDRFLYKANNNPRIALDNLIDFFEEKIQGCNRVAIKFYLLDELINCNIFPNPIE